MPKWQIVLLSVLFATGVIVTVVRTDGSYAHAFVTGECFNKPLPRVCQPRGFRSLRLGTENNIPVH
jgi:hypothetical protein